MKKIILITISVFCMVLTKDARAQNFAGFKKVFLGKKINSAVEHSSKASNNAVQPPVNSGGMTITVGTSGQGFLSVERTLNFTGSENEVVAERSFVRIKTVVKGGFGELSVDTDNPFERPQPLETIGEGYDKLVKEKSIYKLKSGIVNAESGSADFNDFWNQNLPFLSLDSSLNLIVFAMPEGVLKKGAQWGDSASNPYIIIQNQYTVKSYDETVITIECKGNNIFIPDPSLEKSNVISLKVQRLSSKYTGLLVVDKRTGLVVEANFEVISTNRKNIMGQKIDAERQKTIKVVNYIKAN